MTIWKRAVRPAIIGGFIWAVLAIPCAHLVSYQHKVEAYKTQQSMSHLKLYIEEARGNLKILPEPKPFDFTVLDVVGAGFQIITFPFESVLLYLPIVSILWLKRKEKS